MQVLSSATISNVCGRINKISKRYSFSEQTRIKKEITKIMDPFKLKTICRPVALSVYGFSVSHGSKLWAGLPGTFFGKSA